MINLMKDLNSIIIIIVSKAFKGASSVIYIAALLAVCYPPYLCFVEISFDSPKNAFINNNEPVNRVVHPECSICVAQPRLLHKPTVYYYDVLGFP